MTKAVKSYGQYSMTNIAPRHRDDGELYARPKPNPFSNDWCSGYDNALAGLDGYLGLHNPEDYWDGHACGVLEKKELDQSGSSNT